MHCRRVQQKVKTKKSNNYLGFCFNFRYFLVDLPQLRTERVIWPSIDQNNIIPRYFGTLSIRKIVYGITLDNVNDLKKHCFDYHQPKKQGKKLMSADRCMQKSFVPSSERPPYVVSYP
jgi:hypothetical protein